MKKFAKLRYTLLGMLIMAILCAAVVPALAAQARKQLDAYYENIKIVVDGSTITPLDANDNVVEPFIVDGTTYLPVRAVASALGKSVDWDGNTHTVYIGQATSYRQTSDAGLSDPGIYQIYEIDSYGAVHGGAGVVTYTLSMGGQPQVLTVDYGKAHFELNGKEIGGGVYSGVTYCAFMRRPDNSAALFVCTSNPGDYPDTQIYTVKDGQLQMVDEMDLYIQSLSFDSMDVWGSVYYFLGNQFLSGTVGLSDDFTVVYPQDGFLNVSNGGAYTLKVDLPAQKLVDGQYTDVTLRASTQVTPLKMDLDLTRMIVQSAGGNQYLITAVRDYSGEAMPSYQLSDGTLLPEDQVFDGCTYAGP